MKKDTLTLKNINLLFVLIFFSSLSLKGVIHPVFAATTSSSSSSSSSSSGSISTTSSSSSSTASTLNAEEQSKVQKKVDKLEDKIDDKQDDLAELEQKAQNYQRMIDLKQQQQTTLANQLKLMDIQTESLSNSVDITKQDLEENIQELNKVEIAVEEKKNELEKEKDRMAEMLREYHQIDEELSLQMLMSKGDISDILNNSEYLDQASQKVDEFLKAVEEKKNELEREQNELDNKNKELSDKKYKLDEKIYLLANEKNSKSILIEQTEGEEAKYQELLERVEAQKQELLGDIDSLSTEKRDELAKIKSEASTPTTGTASTGWYYSQKDPDWGYNRIGLSSSLMKDYGCAVTSLSMVFTKHGQSITPGKLAAQPIFYRDLIVWPQYWKGLNIVGSTVHGNISWTTIDEEIKNGNPVIVFVRARGGRGHYVVVHGKDKKGNYVVHDPLFGANIYLETTQKLVGAIYNSATTVDQMIIYH